MKKADECNTSFFFYFDCGRPVYTILDFWYGSGKIGTRTNFIRARTL